MIPNPDVDRLEAPVPDFGFPQALRMLKRLPNSNESGRDYSESLGHPVCVLLKSG